MQMASERASQAALITERIAAINHNNTLMHAIVA
jgi:hypothetical protein